MPSQNAHCVTKSVISTLKPELGLQVSKRAFSLRIYRKSARVDCMLTVILMAVNILLLIAGSNLVTNASARSCGLSGSAGSVQSCFALK